ncbi:MAG: 6-carboxytetrahydropterin synthase [Bacteroidales bacterium]|nr:6-carboxytetrahydropterin synthase [Bacteroidales bacterium]
MANKVRVTKEFDFEIAHALWNYDGHCRNLHGHSYKLFVTVIGSPSGDPSDPKNGMVIDFGDLKHIVHDEVVKPLDHSVILNMAALDANLDNISQMFDKRYVVDYQPTCENLVVDLARRISRRLPAGVFLHSLKLHETASSFAEWYASDNPEE